MITCNLESRKVHIGGVPLDPAVSQAIVNHSPDGFGWGYNGSGPAQLALAILLHYEDQEFALAHYQDFKFDIVSGWGNGNVLQPERKVKAWIAARKGSNVLHVS